MMEQFTNRRGFLTQSALAAGTIGLGACSTTTKMDAQPATVTSASVRDFGAVGDGKHDDTEALREAFKSIPSGTAVHLPRGDYVLSGVVDIPPTCALMGEPFGARLIVRHYDAPAIRVAGETRLSDVAILYPDNTDGKSKRVSRIGLSCRQRCGICREHNLHQCLHRGGHSGGRRQLRSKCDSKTQRLRP